MVLTLRTSSSCFWKPTTVNNAFLELQVVVAKGLHLQLQPPKRKETSEAGESQPIRVRTSDWAC